MTISRRLISISLAVVFLVSCSSVSAIDNPTSTPSPFSQPVPTVDNFKNRLTATNLPIFTSTPSVTPNTTQTAFSQYRISTRVAEQTLIAQYPRACELLYSAPEFSPNRLWMGELCLSDDGQDYILAFSNKERQTIWKLHYKDYVTQTNNFPDGGMSIIHWSSDEKYAYFYSYLGGDGGECYIGSTNTGIGLFRIDLQTGHTTSILPVNDTKELWYTFSFSPTGRRLVYEANSQGLRILDLSTGGLSRVVTVSDFSQNGGYVWSPDGLQFVYSTVTTLDNWETRSYSLRLVDAMSGNEQIILDSPDRCFVARLWSEDNVLTVENYNEDNARALYDRVLMEIDLKSNKIISEITVTPFP